MKEQFIKIIILSVVSFVLSITFVFASSNYTYDDGTMSVTIEGNSWICIDNDNIDEKINQTDFTKEYVKNYLDADGVKFFLSSKDGSVLGELMVIQTESYKNFSSYSDSELIEENNSGETMEGFTRVSSDVFTNNGYKFLIDVQKQNEGNLCQTSYINTVDGNCYMLEFLTDGSPSTEAKTAIESLVKSMQFCVEPVSELEYKTLSAVGVGILMIFIIPLLASIIILFKKKIRLSFSKKESIAFVLLLGIEIATDLFIVDEASNSSVYGAGFSSLFIAALSYIVYFSYFVTVATIFRIKKPVERVKAIFISAATLITSSIVAIYGLSALNSSLKIFLPIALCILSTVIMTSSSCVSNSLAFVQNEKIDDVSKKEKTISEPKTVLRNTIGTASTMEIQNKTDKNTNASKVIKDKEDVDPPITAETKHVAEDIEKKTPVKTKSDNVSIPVEELTLLKELYEAGVLTEKEFKEKKKKILGI